MKFRLALACGLSVLLLPHWGLTQEVRRAQPARSPVPRAQPADEVTVTPSSAPKRPTASPSEAPASETAGPPAPAVAPETMDERPAEERQLDFANALFARKLHDLAIPEYEKFLGQFPNASGRASAFFYLGECYRALKRTPAARTSFQSVLDHHPESEFAGPAAYGVAEILFNQKNFAEALPLFHRAANKTKEPALALSARYFEARSLESLNRKDEARALYQDVIEAKNPNPYRNDSRMAVALIYLASGKKAEALKHYEALANEATTSALKAEATVRAGMMAADLQQADSKSGSMADKAVALLQKGINMPEAGKWKNIAQVGLLRLHYQTGRYEKMLSEYKKQRDDLPEETRAEMMLLAANSQRQLGRSKEADEIYGQIMAKYPGREEAKDARYQRLINLYNTGSADLHTEVAAFLEANPSGERSDQARLLQAEAFYKESKFGDAAALYKELRASQLIPRLRAEAAYKLGWCFTQLKQTEDALEAFEYFMQAFSDNAQAPSVLAQRAIAHQELNNFPGALDDLDQLLTKYPKAAEREAALQQKALILGKQENNKAMADTFRQLLKEFPKSPAASQAHYYIGKAAFEAKDYKAALTPLNSARSLNKEQFFTPATLRIISIYFYLKDRRAATTEVDEFVAADPNAKVPAEVLEWLGLEFFNEGNHAAAAKYLTLLSRSEMRQNARPDYWFYLGEAEAALNNFPAAERAFEQYLITATDPAGKAKALLALGKAKIGAHKADDAQRIAEEIIKLQPEGRVNAEARLLGGEAELERGRFDEAGRAFMRVALLYDDPEITPRALQKAASAFERAGKTEEADKIVRQLRQRYPDFAGG